jgi:hypothetical protein
MKEAAANWTSTSSAIALAGWLANPTESSAMSTIGEKSADSSVSPAIRAVQSVVVVPP